MEGEKHSLWKVLSIFNALWKLLSPGFWQDQRKKSSRNGESTKDDKWDESIHISLEITGSEIMIIQQNKFITDAFMLKMYVFFVNL